MIMKTSMARFAVLAAVVACLPALLLGQKAGVITKYVQPAMVVQPPARPGLQEVSTSLTGSNIPVKWHDVLRTDIGGRIRAQLNDGSILSIGSKSQLIVQKHDEKAQQSAFDLSYGKVRTQVVKLARPDSSFEVRTATAVCGVLGTDDIVDAENPTATVVIVISGVVVVRSSDPRVVGSVQLTAGQTTTVTAGQPPTQPTAATAVQVSGAVLGTSGSVDPDPTVASLPPSLTAGSPLLLDGRSSTGGLGSIASYSWSFTPNPFVNGLQQPNLSDSFLDLNTTGWPAGNYVGRLTVTNTAGRTATVTFQFAVVAAPAVPPPDATVNALAAAYETLQVRSFMNLFDPVKYNGYAALEQSITQSFANIQTNRVFVQKAAGQTQGNSAILQVNFTIRFTPKVTALASPGVAPPPMRAFARGGAAATGSISGSAGAVQTQVVVSGPLTETVLSPNNSLNYTAPNLPDGTYTVTPMRTAFVFTPSSRTVVVANGAAVTGVDFSAQPLEQTVTEQATLRMELEGDKGWMITDIQGGLGSAGLVGIPGTNTATGINSPGSGSGNGMIIPGTPSFTVTSPATYTVVQGGSNAATPALITVNGTNGFSGPVTITFPSTPGVSIVSGPPTITVPPGGITAAASYVFAFSPTVTGLTAVPYLATAGSITQSAFIAFQIQTLSLNVTGPGQTAGTGLQLFSGNSASTSLLLVSNPPGFNGSATYTTQPSVGGINAAVVAGANGAAKLNVPSTDSNSGPFQIVVSAKTASGAVVSTTVFVNRFPPITSGLSLTPPNLTIAQGQPGNYVVNVPFNSGYVLSATIVPPTLPNVTFVPVNPLPNASGKVTLTQTGTATFQVLTNSTTFTNPSGDFVISAGAFQALVHTTVTLNPPFDFTIAASGTTLAQGTLANVSVAVAQVTGSGAGPLPVTISIGALPTGISANVISGGTINGTGSAVINVGAAANAPLGTTSFLVTGTAGGVTHSATVSVTVTSTGSFTLTTTPATVNAPEGGVGSVTVGVTAIGGFSDPVTITAASTVAQVAGPGTITPGSSAPYSITATGAGTITFTGSTAAMSQTASVAVALVPGFSLTAPSGQGFPGGTTTITVAISRLFPPFTAPVTITASSSGATFTQSTVTTTGNSADFVVNIPPTATGAISVSFSGVVQGGKLTVPASSSISLAAPFSLTGSAVSGFAGQSVPVVIPVTRNGSFTGAVTVTAAAGIPGAIVTPSSVTVQPGQTSAAFVVTIPAGATSGSIIFNGTAVGQTTSATVTITIGAPFTISAGSNLGVIVPGGSVQTTVTIGFAQSFNGPVVLTVGVVGTATASISPTSLSAAGTAQLTVSAPAGAGAGSSSITVTAASGSFTLTSVYVINTAQIPLTISANSKTRVFGAPNPTFDATFSGFVAPDGPQSLSGALACATAANVSSPVGSYQINCAGLSSTKYAITYSPGTLTVPIAGSTTSLASSTTPTNVGQTESPPPTVPVAGRVLSRPGTWGAARDG